MTGNITIDEFYEVCEEFNLEFHTRGENLVIRQKNLGTCELFGSIAIYYPQFKNMSVSNGIREIKIQNNRTHEKIFSQLEYQSHIKYSNVNDVKKQIQKVLKNYKDIKIKLKLEEIDKDFE